MNGGGAAPFEELVSIAALCRERNVRLHLDGARLWEVAPHFGKSYAEICAVFDTAYVSFYKGVGALSGAMILGPADVINHTKVWQKRRGSNAFTFGPAALSCQHSLEGALNGSVASFEERYAWIGRMVATVSAIAAGVAMKGQLFFDPSVPQSAMVHCYLRGDAGLLEACHVRERVRRSAVACGCGISFVAVGIRHCHKCAPWSVALPVIGITLSGAPGRRTR